MHLPIDDYIKIEDLGEASITDTILKKLKRILRAAEDTVRLRYGKDYKNYLNDFEIKFDLKKWDNSEAILLRFEWNNNDKSEARINEFNSLCDTYYSHGNHPLTFEEWCLNPKVKEMQLYYQTKGLQSDISKNHST